MFIALAALMMIAFTRCGVSGSKEYNDMMNYLKKVEKVINDAKTCEDLEKASDLFWQGIEDNEYAEEDRMTEDENEKVLEYLKKIDDGHKSLIEKLGCD